MIGKLLRYFIFLFFLSLSSALTESCGSVNSYNRHLEKYVSVDHMRSDIDYAYLKLQKLHPDLYRYISKETLTFKIDSLKNSLHKPLKPQQFFDAFQPVIAQIRQGHLTLMMPMKRLHKSEIKELKRQKGLLGRLNYLVANDSLFVKSNSQDFAKIKPGTQILKVNGQPVQDYLNQYARFITADGFNTTFKNPRLAQIWPDFFTAQVGIKDSLELQTEYDSKIRDFYIHRERVSKVQEKKQKQEVKEIQKEKDNKLKDYNVSKGEFNRYLQFVVKDSSTAYMRIRTFSGVFSSQFYKSSFEQLKKGKTKFLIIDIRGNLGGSLEEIKDLYSYFVAEPQPFIRQIQVSEKQWALAADYFDGMGWAAKPFGAIVYPFYELANWLATYKREGKYYAGGRKYLTYIRKPKTNGFQGKVYLLIDGTSFSASAIIAAKFKNDHRAFLVGEESGGANDGTVAGRYSTKKLPQSHIILPIPLMLIEPNITFTNTNRGVVPDQVIIPSREDEFDENDVALKWVFRQIENYKIKQASVN